VLIKKNRPLKDPPKVEYNNEELNIIIYNLLIVFNTLKVDIREL